jgi:S-DNA-T family DNA segregation ATPase FtsK/SpoIIIE
VLECARLPGRLGAQLREIVDVSNRAEHPDTATSANHMMRRALHELERVRSLAAGDAEEIRNLRERVRKALFEAEREARAEVGGFTPRDLGGELRLDLTHKFRPDMPSPGDPQTPPSSFDAARSEWAALAGPTEQQVRDVITARTLWDHRAIKRQRSKPVIPEDLWRNTQRLSEIHAALPPLRERVVSERLASKAHLNVDLAAEIEKRAAALEREFSAARRLLEDVEESAGVTGGTWGHPGWIDALPVREIQRVTRIGEFDPRLPRGAGIGPVPALLDFPFHAGLAIATDVGHRASAIDLARSLVLRALAATPAGDIRFVFIDPVSLGQAVADFRHLSEFDPRLVDTKTWTSERDIESRLEELSDHLEVVISTYLRGQFGSIDDYNRQAGEVAEPYRMLVVFDYPTGFTARSARQLLSLIENGTRCGVHTILVYDPSRKPADEVPYERLVHSMQQIDLTKSRGVSLPEPIGPVDLDFLPDASPPISFSPDGRAASPFAQLLVNVGGGARTTQSGPVTLHRVVPIINRQVVSGRARQAPQMFPGSPDLDAGDQATWWRGTTAEGAYAPIGRAGAQDVAAMYFSSTEIAGGAIVVGLPRAGKSTALHAAIVSTSIIYSPDELELYLIDSKHGVEFKVYDQLPHARLVSINSEREFSVSVLQSLNDEIRRRAELMKRRAAGKANITEYRSATGEFLPRIVLFMDEFHELFEEDDAVGQQAFQAFSNIVRQGPFAGVHIVVASQTLSSMPAMDRGTLSLLPMRVAFMCNESDADLVMGDTNREVKALSQQGEGIFNPSRGEPSHNKPFRGLYVPPDERDALLREISAKAAKAGFLRQPRVFDGDILAERPDKLSRGSATRPQFAIGEPFSLEPSAGVRLRRGRGANLLLLGANEDDDASPKSAVDGATHSVLVDAIAQGLVVQVIDFIGDSDSDQYGLDLMALCEALGVDYRRGSALTSILASANAEVALRREAEDYKAGAHLLLLSGLQRALDLAPEDQYADADESEQPPLARLLTTVLRDGPEVGCHTAVVIDSMAQFDRRLGRDMLNEFDWRIAGSELSPADIIAITESYTESDIRQSQLLLADHGRGKSQRVRAYPRYTGTSIRKATDRNRA